MHTVCPRHPKIGTVVAMHMIFLVVFANLAVFVWLSQRFASLLIQQEDVKLHAVAQTAASFLPQYHDSISLNITNELSTRYFAVAKHFWELSKQLDIEYIFGVIEIDGEFYASSVTGGDPDGTPFVPFMLHLEGVDRQRYIDAGAKPWHGYYQNAYGGGRISLVPLRDAHNRTYYWGASFPTDAFDQRMRSLYMSLGAIGFVLVLIGVGLSGLIASRVGRPMANFTRTVERLASGDYTQIVPGPTSFWEEKILVNSFNAMAGSIQRTVAELSISNENLTATINSYPDAVLVTGLRDEDGEDEHGEIVRMSGPAETLTGWTLYEAQSQATSTVFTLADPDGRPFSLDVFLKNLAVATSSSNDSIAQDAIARGPTPQVPLPSSGSATPIRHRSPSGDDSSGSLAAHIPAGPRRDHLPDTLVLTNRAGSKRTVSVTFNPMRHPDGGYMGTVMVFRDVTEQTALSERLRQAQKLESVGQLAGGIAHDFNNMLAGIMGSAELLIATLLSEGTPITPCCTTPRRQPMLGYDFLPGCGGSNTEPPVPPSSSQSLLLAPVSSSGPVLRVALSALPADSCAASASPVTLMAPPARASAPFSPGSEPSCLPLALLTCRSSSPQVCLPVGAESQHAYTPGSNDTLMHHVPTDSPSASSQVGSFPARVESGLQASSTVSDAADASTPLLVVERVVTPVPASPTAPAADPSLSGRTELLRVLPPLMNGAVGSPSIVPPQLAEGGAPLSGAAQTATPPPSNASPPPAPPVVAAGTPAAAPAERASPLNTHSSSTSHSHSGASVIIVQPSGPPDPPPTSGPIEVEPAGAEGQPGLAGRSLGESTSAECDGANNRSQPASHQRLLELSRMVLSASEKAASLTQKLLDFARKGKIVSAPLDVHQLIMETCHLLARSIDPRITIAHELLAPRSMVMGDPAQLQNALLNLGLNSRDAMPEGPGRITYSTRLLATTVPPPPNEPTAAAAAGAAAASGTATTGADTGAGGELQQQQPGAASAGSIQISVTDTGCGMPPEVQRRLFEPFFTTKEIGKGTGLGLASVYGTIRDHHGQISFTSAVGKGTTFTIVLNLLPAPHGRTRHHHTHGHPSQAPRLSILPLADLSASSSGSLMHVASASSASSAVAPPSGPEGSSARAPGRPGSPTHTVSSLSSLCFPGALPRRLVVLVVDDEPVMRNMLGSQLRFLGCDALMACDGLEGLDQFRRLHEHLHAVVLDMLMPRMGRFSPALITSRHSRSGVAPLLGGYTRRDGSGREAFKAMHALDGSVPIFVASGFLKTGGITELLQAGAAGFFHKPFRLQELSSALHEVAARPHVVRPMAAPSGAAHPATSDPQSHPPGELERATQSPAPADQAAPRREGVARQGGEEAPLTEATLDPVTLRVLLIDDNPVNLDLLKAQITRVVTQLPKTAGVGSSRVPAVMAGCVSISLANSGREAVRLLEEALAATAAAAAAGTPGQQPPQSQPQCPHLVLTDISMPDMDGVECARRLRSLLGGRPSPALPCHIYAVTGHSEVEGAEGGLFDGCLQKPVRMQRLEALLRAHFRFV
ncbi:putative PAS domain S-box protein [Paratrimastix pyriformis]|uniref:histidine kinase n=1 Tax=Paratrimastix pyriformis TaxID=342808 RepID=A0ABQ8UAJ3_9EUKA|nr:putative PAS domain S-box protein [Paratrimastix pyriformis]